MKLWLALGLCVLCSPLRATAEASLENAARTTTASHATSGGRHPIDPEATLSDVRDWRSGGLFVAGALTGFFAHEAGHLVANFAYGNVPRLEGLWAFGFVPFFAIAPRIYCKGDTCVDHEGKRFHGGPRGKFVITSAGFNVQHITDEVLLSYRPYLRYQRGPFQKGLLAFNTLLSLGYSIASWTGIEDPHGDVSRSAGLVGLPSPLYAGMLFLPAALDICRYFWPEQRWVPWVSRGSKLAFVGLTFGF